MYSIIIFGNFDFIERKWSNLIEIELDILLKKMRFDACRLVRVVDLGAFRENILLRWSLIYVFY